MATKSVTPKKLSSHVQSAANGFAIKDTNTFSSISKVISVATDKKSLINSKKLHDFLVDYIENLPTKKMQDKDVVGVKENIVMSNKLKNSLESFLEPLKKIMEIDVILDAKDVCAIMDNLNKCVSLCKFISDYLTTAIDVHETKSALKKIKSISLEELHQLLEEA